MGKARGLGRCSIILSSEEAKATTVAAIPTYGVVK